MKTRMIGGKFSLPLRLLEAIATSRLMENHFEAGLDTLKQKLLTMASHAETAVNQAVQSLMQRDHDLAVKVRANDNIIDQFEIEIDEMAIQLLTKAPLATNLRLSPWR